MKIKKTISLVIMCSILMVVGIHCGATPKVYAGGGKELEWTKWGGVQ